MIFWNSFHCLVKIFINFQPEMMLKLCFVLLFSLVAPHVAVFDQKLMEKLVAHQVGSAANCSTVRFAEWNAAVARRYETHKAKLGIKNDECLVASKIADEGFGPSGLGSSPKCTKPLRELLKTLFEDKSRDIKSFFDVPCGDWVWMQHVDLSNIAYLGGDITTMTINENKKCFEKPNIQFVQFDLTCNPIPEVDLMLTRDVLFHLKEDVAIGTLNNISKSKVRYFLSTTFMQENKLHGFDNTRSYGETHRGRNSTIGYRDINLFDKPYCMPKPEMKVQEVLGGIWRD